MKVKFSVFILTIFFSISLIGCGYVTVDSVNDYRRFLSDYTKYGFSVEPKPPDPPTPPIIEPTKQVADVKGFSPLSNVYFDFGKAFDGMVAYCVKGSDAYYLFADGKMDAAITDLSAVSTQNGYILTSNTGKVGVYDVFGACILPTIYDSISIIDTTILAIKENHAITLQNGTMIGSCDFVYHAILLQASYVIVDTLICDLTLAPQSIGGYPYADYPSDGIVPIKTDNRFYRYIQLSDESFVGDKYIGVEKFSEGTAVAKTEDGATVVIDTAGNILYRTEELQITERHCGYYCYVQYNRYGVMDNQFNDLTEPIFDNVRYEQAVGDYVIVQFDTGERIYSLTERKYIAKTYDSIEYQEGLFVCHENNSVILMDSDLQEILQCQSAVMHNGILMVKVKDGYAYYTRNTI